MEASEPLPQGVTALFIKPVLPRPALVVIGTAPVAKTLVPGETR